MAFCLDFRVIEKTTSGKSRKTTAFIGKNLKDQGPFLKTTPFLNLVLFYDQGGLHPWYQPLKRCTIKPRWNHQSSSAQTSTLLLPSAASAPERPCKILELFHISKNPYEICRPPEDLRFKSTCSPKKRFESLKKVSPRPKEGRETIRNIFGFKIHFPETKKVHCSLPKIYILYRHFYTV